MERRQFMQTLSMGVASLAISGCIKNKNGTSDKPNILFIMSDDHASHAIGCYGSRLNQTPNIDRIAQKGVRFDNCFCTNGICAPSRAVILTGKHSHINGVRDNRLAFDGSQETFPKLLQSAGYQTALIGKWHLKSDPTGFDYWNILPGQGHYYNPDLIEMGMEKRVDGYVTDILTGTALDYLKNKRDKSKPFLLMFHHKAPHRNWQPPLRYLTKFDDVDFPEPANLFDDYATRSAAASEQEMTLKEHMQPDYDLKMGDAPERMTEEQKKAWNEVYGPKKDNYEQENPEGDDLVRWKYRRYMQDYLGCIAAVDDSIGKILDYLDDSGLAANTLVVYTSDQGFYLGEHGWFDKRFMYEESLKMPLLVCYPDLASPASVNQDMVSNLDFAPTFLDLAGVNIPPEIQGRSFKNILKGKEIKDWRESFYYHYYEYPAVHMVKRHYGIRTKQYKLMHFYYDIDAWELYDLEKDPLEMNNVYGDPAYQEIAQDLKKELLRLRDFYKDSEELDKKFIEADLKARE